jgi:sigma-B regulation protein RsbU (phosphoserine phosphatase)
MKLGAACALLDNNGAIMEDLLEIDGRLILDSLGDGVYVTDVERRIIYWNTAAERITGWKAGDIVGRCCFDNILCHVDKDGHRMCGKEYCPLHRSIVTGIRSEYPLIFAQGKNGQRIPMQTTVAPIRNTAGKVIGGVETFRDISPVLHDLEKAKAIQAISLQHDLPQDARIQFSTHYIPHDIVGGDYYGIKQLDQDHYGFLLADVAGHGLAAALYTMYFSSLWDRYHRLLATPSSFAKKIGNELKRLVRDDEAFATGICGLADASRQEVRFTGAGNPPALLIRASGEFEQLECAGLPFGLMEDAPYDDTALQLRPGDRLLFFSDGAIEIQNAENTLPGIDGLITILKNLGYPKSGIQITAVEEALLAYSNAVRLEDDLTLIEVRFAE